MGVLEFLDLANRHLELLDGLLDVGVGVVVGGRRSGPRGRSRGARAGWRLLHLLPASDQVEVAPRLVLGLAHHSQVAVMIDPHWGSAAVALGQVGREGVGELLVDPAAEAVFRPIAEEPEGSVLDGCAG